MLRLIIIVLFLYVVYRLIKSFFRQGREEIHKSGTAGLIDEMVQDPFCKTYIPCREAFKKVLGGNEIFFCSKECAEKFESQAEGEQTKF
ncbi:YHS domain-containing protein [Thermodesulfobacteriota bacterium]